MGPGIFRALFFLRNAAQILFSILNEGSAIGFLNSRTSVVSKTYPRARFTRALTEICKALDTSSEKLVDIESTLGSIPLEGTANVRILRLWAFGSWSRGALECRDLDLAVEYTARWEVPPKNLGDAFLVPGHLVLPRVLLRKPPGPSGSLGSEDSSTGAPGAAPTPARLTSRTEGIALNCEN